MHFSKPPYLQSPVVPEAARTARRREACDVGRQLRHALSRKKQGSTQAKGFLGHPRWNPVCFPDYPHMRAFGLAGLQVAIVLWTPTLKGLFCFPSPWLSESQEEHLRPLLLPDTLFYGMEAMMTVPC